jgi:predicted GNAT superfamily acetyltransferase
VATATGAGSAGFAFRPLRKPEEFRHAEELQREALGAEAPLAVPAGLLKELQEHGGLVLGAFADIYLAGLTASAIGWDGATLYHQSLVTVVRPEYQQHRVGLRLKAFQRDEVLRLGLAEVRWTIDPIHRAAASLSVRRLGARPDAYLANYFGQVEAPGGPREESDRLRLRWSLSDPEVERRVGGTTPTPADDLARHGRSSTIVRTETSETGLRLPTAVEEPDGPSASLEIPFDLGSLRAHEPASVRRWRHAVRDGLRAAFDLGYRIDDLASVSLEHERRAFYFLSPGEPAAPPPAPGRGPGAAG